ncbi:uncharacterized protein LOC134717176 [Mytilus trossulus]|uniref:uncharacterized protein LOC134717176 n=1 Tax=Mytilus trossulus TaxID=6551 RepID=UPI003005E758
MVNAVLPFQNGQCSITIPEWSIIVNEVLPFQNGRCSLTIPEWSMECNHSKMVDRKLSFHKRKCSVTIPEWSMKYYHSRMVNVVLPFQNSQSRDSHIIQLSAVNSQNTKFNRYIKPARPILPQASEVTGLKFQNGKMYHDDREVQSIGISNALTAFILFLKEIHNTVLVGHNSKTFDVPILINALEKNGLLNNFMSSVKGFIDTLPLFKECIPNQPSYSQPKIYNTLFGELYSAHDSMEDVVALRRLFEKISPSLVLKSKFSGTYESVMQLYQHRNCTKGLLTTLRPLTNSKTITNCMATKIASSGLGLSHLKLAHKRDRQQGIENLFTELCGHPSKARVTKSKKNNTGNINLSE